MGCVKNIGFNEFPKQGQWINRRVTVCFHYDSSKEIGGVIVRDDMEEPYRGIIRLDDGRYVLMTECQYGLAMEVKQ